MSKDAAVTVRIPAGLKRKLAARAEAEKRSLSAQIAVYLERGVEGEGEARRRAPGRLLGLYQGSLVPSEEDFREARRLLWRSLARRRRANA